MVSGVLGRFAVRVVNTEIHLSRSHLEARKEVQVDGGARLFGQVEGVDPRQGGTVDEGVEHPHAVLSVQKKMVELKMLELPESADGEFELFQDGAAGSEDLRGKSRKRKRRKTALITEK